MDLNKFAEDFVDQAVEDGITARYLKLYANYDDPKEGLYICSTFSYEEGCSGGCGCGDLYYSIGIPEEPEDVDEFEFEEIPEDGRISTWYISETSSCCSGLCRPYFRVLSSDEEDYVPRECWYIVNDLDCVTLQDLAEVRAENGHHVI